MSRRAYAQMFGPTTGDCVRLGDTSLLARVERDHTVYGDECLCGGGKTVRDGMAVSRRTVAEGALDLLIANALVIDPVIGIVKGDIGVRNGRIVGIGKAGNPDVMDGVDEALVVGNATVVESAEGRIVTAGGIDVHTHFIGADQCDHALSAGLTTLIGGGMSQPFIAVDQGSPTDIFRMLRACDGIPLNFGLFARGSSHTARAIGELMDCGVIGVKIHEDFGAPPAVVDTCLSLADDLDFPVQLHTDTLNESGYYEDTMAAIAGRTVHMYHTEGAGGGHAPDIIRCNAEAHCLPSSTNPTNPYTVNTFDEHLDMTMVGHMLKPDIPEDVAHAESRIRAGTIAAEDVLHDIGAISMLGSDSQGMGRINEVITRTWQLAARMRDVRGRLPGESGQIGDNERIKRYIAKYTLNAARTFGIDAYVGSLEPGKMADLVIWDPAFFGAKPRTVFKAGYCVWSVMGDGAACLNEVEPVVHRPQWGACGGAPASLAATFVHPSATDADVSGRAGLAKPLEPIAGTRRLSKADMWLNDRCPVIEVNPQTFEVFVDGELATCEPASALPLTQSYYLR